MVTHFILVIDVGTQSLRASLVNDQGEIVTMVTRTYEAPYFSNSSGYAEQNADYYFDHLCEAIKELGQKDSIRLRLVKSMVIATFRDTAVLLDEEKKPIRPMILWLDQRMAELPGEKHIPFINKMLFKIVGMWETVKLNSRRTGAMWLRENEPETWSKVRWYVPLGAYLNYRLTGKLCVSDADVVGHYAFDSKKKQWLGKNALKYCVFGIDKEMNPDLVPCGQAIGTLTEEALKKTGLEKPLTIYASGSDKACEVFGDGCVEPYKAAVCLGTACTIDIPCHKYVEPEAFLPAYGAAYPDDYNDEVQIYRGFWMLKWFADTFATVEEKEKAEKFEIPVESLMDQRMEKIVPGSDGLLVQPYWGPGLKRPLARGAIVGFRDSQDKSHIYRATIEGIGFCLREGMEEMQHRMHCKVKRLVVSGGGSRNDSVAQIMADIFNMPVSKTVTQQSSTIGAAMAGFLAEGVFTSPNQAVEQMVHYKKCYMPDEEASKIYNQIYKEGYLKLFPKLDKIYQKLGSLAVKERNYKKDGK